MVVVVVVVIVVVVIVVAVVLDLVIVVVDVVNSVVEVLITFKIAKSSSYPLCESSNFSKSPFSIDWSVVFSFEMASEPSEFMIRFNNRNIVK